MAHPQITIVNACLRDGHGGSPTAVLDDAPMSDDERRRVPELAGTSHAVFVAHEDEAVASLRFFTATGELPACGHGTVAALTVLLLERGGHDAHRITLRASGRAFAGEARHAHGRVWAAFDPGVPELRDATREQRRCVLDAFGGAREIDARGILVASLGRPRLLVPVTTPAALARLQPDSASLRIACDRLGMLGCYVHSRSADNGRLAARMFAPSIGVPEDIANANSTACLAASLATRGLDRISVDMGDSLGSPATIAASIRRTPSGLQIRVGGTAEIVSREYFAAESV